jgi:hypothetical protein
MLSAGVWLAAILCTARSSLLPVAFWVLVDVNKGLFGLIYPLLDRVP